METRHWRHRLPAVGGGVALAVLAGCMPGGGKAAAGSYDEVVIAVPDWVGGKANAAVAAHVLTEELGATVRLMQLDQTMAWKLLDEGGVHAVLEDWGGLPDEQRLYVDDRRSVVSAGELGPVGKVGWYVPQSFAGSHPGVLDWQRLNDFAELFATDTTGGLGRLLTGHPRDASYDEELIESLELDYSPVAAGSEQQLIEALRRADRGGSALLANWWQPHWLHEELELAEVELPPFAAGCYETGARPPGAPDGEPSGCGYPDIPLRKYLNADFAELGGEAAEFLAGFTWSAEEQNEVAQLIEGQGMTPQGAAALWLESNQHRVDDWFPDSD